MGMKAKHKPETPDSQNGLQRTANLLRKLVQVPKADLPTDTRKTRLPDESANH